MAKKMMGVNPWTHIWTHPRETISSIVKFNPKYRFIILSFLYGLPMLLYWAQDLSLGESFTVMGISLGSVILATFVGMLAMTIASGLLLWTGKWIGGKASYYPIRAAVSWSNVPNIFTIIIWAILIYMFGGNLFMHGFPQENIVGPALIILVVALIIQAVLAIWSFIILVKGLGEVQGFSAWKGLLNVLIPFFMVGVLIWVIMWLIWAVVGMIGM